MSPFTMYGLLMRNVSVQIEDKYNCLHNIVPTNPKKLVEQLTKIETKLVTEIFVRSVTYVTLFLIQIISCACY